MSYTVPCFRAFLLLILRNLRGALNGKKVGRDVWFYYCSLFCGPSCLEEFCPAMNAHLHLTPPGQGSGSGALFSHSRPLLLCLGAHFFKTACFLCGVYVARALVTSSPLIHTCAFCLKFNCRNASLTPILLGKKRLEPLLGSMKYYCNNDEFASDFAMDFFKASCSHGLVHSLHTIGQCHCLPSLNHYSAPTYTGHSPFFGPRCQGLKPRRVHKQWKVGCLSISLHVPSLQCSVSRRLNPTQ